MLLELSGSAGVPPATDLIVRKYTWGLDLSQTLAGAGGIGGLLALEEPQTVGDPLKYVYFYDANGNVGQVVDLAAANAIQAKYEYDAYARHIMHSSGRHEHVHHHADISLEQGQQVCRGEAAAGLLFGRLSEAALWFRRIRHRAR